MAEGMFSVETYDGLPLRILAKYDAIDPLEGTRRWRLLYDPTIGYVMASFGPRKIFSKSGALLETHVCCCVALGNDNLADVRNTSMDAETMMNIMYDPQLFFVTFFRRTYTSFKERQFPPPNEFHFPA